MLWNVVNTRVLPVLGPERKVCWIVMSGKNGGMSYRERD
jgi:hypothetical protein